MGLVFIFDLDNTLTDTNRIKHVKYANPYSVIKPDVNLQKLLNKINNKKIIFSNATIPHVISVLDALGIRNLFSNIVDRNITKTLKPNLNSYIELLKNSNINELNKCIFFDDLIPNLITGKYLGWITVLISKQEQIENNTIKHKSIDYCFRSIHDALIYFIKEK
jgi:putative hydrolase of the HAD superfamily